MTLTQLSKKERYLLTVRGEQTDRPPVWLMRQAGRYLPEYQALRERYSFLELCRDPRAAAAATLLPLEILDVDVLIIFNDILIPLAEMGLDVKFPEGGPQIGNPLRAEADLEKFEIAAFDNPPVAQSIQLTKAKAEDAPVLGFCGAPFTLALYAIEGRTAREVRQTLALLYEQPELLHEILSRITATAANYLIAQIEQGGADGVQIFESWGGFLSAANYIEFAEQYQRRLIEQVKAACPETPLQLFVKGAPQALERADATAADVLSIDWTIPLAAARRRTKKTLQGNLDPLALCGSEAAVVDAFAKMLEGFDWRRGWIANLGHGVTPQAGVAAAKRFVQCLRELK